MQLRVDRLTEHPSPVQHRATPAWWADWCRAGAEDAGEAIDIVEDLAFDGHAHVLLEDVLLEGEFSGALDAQCGRCLKRYRQRLRESYRLLLEPLKEGAPVDPEGVEMLERYGMWLGEDLEAGFYRGKEIDLAPFYAEVVALAIPVQPICKEDCAGLCPHCGIDRSQASCECVDTKPDSPFAALAALKGSQAGSS